MSARVTGPSVRAVLRELCERLEDLCDQQASDDLKRAVKIVEELALESPRLEATKSWLQRVLEADDQLLEKIELEKAARYDACTKR